MESSHRWTFVRYFGTQQVPIGMPGRTHARTGVTLNEPPPFFEWRGHNKNIMAFYHKSWKLGDPLPPSFRQCVFESCLNIVTNLLRVFVGVLLSWCP